MRDLEKDQKAIDMLWEREVIDDGDDIALILTIADHALRRAKEAERKLSESGKVS
jgi:hypothetical protein